MTSEPAHMPEISLTTKEAAQLLYILQANITKDPIKIKNSQMGKIPRHRKLIRALRKKLDGAYQ